MQAHQLPCDTVTYNTLLDGLCSAHRISEAFSVLHTMEEKGIIPNIVTYSVLIEGLCKDGKVDMAKDIFDKLQSIGLQPDVVTYNILISALSTEARIEEAKKLVIQMVRKGCLPDCVTYIVFLQGLVKIKVLHETIPILDEMERRGFKLNAITFSMLIQLLEEEGGDGVLFDKDEVERRLEEARQSLPDGTLPPPVNPNEIYLELVGGPNSKNRIFGIGSVWSGSQSATSPAGCSPSQPTSIGPTPEEIQQQVHRSNWRLRGLFTSSF